MIPNHKQFIEAINEKHKLCLRFYSLADSGVLDLVCAPLDYGPGAGVLDGVNRYWFWDYTSNTASPTLGLLPEQVLDIRILGEVFNPSEFVLPPPMWSIPRDWRPPCGSGTENPSRGPAQAEKHSNSTEASNLVNN
jgi:hypothetical protein